jgi:predicted nucleic acid-binding protein
MRLVLDTSAAVNIVLQTAHAPALMAILERADRVIAPALMHSELGNALWKAVRFANLDLPLAMTHFEDAISLVDEFIADETLLRQALRNAVLHAHPVYDMVFVAAAQQHGCSLLSLDQKLLALARGIDPNLVADVQAMGL